MKGILMHSAVRAAVLLTAFFGIVSSGAVAQETIPHDRFLEAPSPHGLAVESVLKASTTVLGQPIEYTKTDLPEVVSVLQLFQPGGETGWHYHIHSSHIYVVEGTLQLEMLDGKKLEFKQGQAYMESVKVWHNGRNIGPGPLKLLVVSFLEKDKSNNVFGKAQ